MCLKFDEGVGWRRVLMLLLLVRKSACLELAPTIFKSSLGGCSIRLLDLVLLLIFMRILALYLSLCIP